MSAFKSQFCNMFVHIKVNKMPWKVWKVVLFWKTTVRFLYEPRFCL